MRKLSLFQVLGDFTGQSSGVIRGGRYSNSFSECFAALANLFLDGAAADIDTPSNSSVRSDVDFTASSRGRRCFRSKLIFLPDVSRGYEGEMEWSGNWAWALFTCSDYKP